MAEHIFLLVINIVLYVLILYTIIHIVTSYKRVEKEQSKSIS